MLGSGEGNDAALLRRAGLDVVVVDVSGTATEAADRGVADAVTADVRHLSSVFRPGSFDLVVDKATGDAVASHADGIARLDDLHLEVKRILAPGGTFVSISHADRSDFVSDAALGWSVDSARIWRTDCGRSSPSPATAAGTGARPSSRATGRRRSSGPATTLASSWCGLRRARASPGPGLRVAVAAAAAGPRTFAAAPAPARRAARAPVALRCVYREMYL